MMSFDCFDNSNGAIRRSATTNLAVASTDWSMKDTLCGDCSTHPKRSTQPQRRAGLYCMRPKATTSRIQVKTSLIEGKWLEMLKEDRTARTRVAIMFNPDTAPLGRAYFMGSFEAPLHDH